MEALDQTSWAEVLSAVAKLPLPLLGCPYWRTVIYMIFQHVHVLETEKYVGWSERRFWNFTGPR